MTRTKQKKRRKKLFRNIIYSRAHHINMKYTYKLAARDKQNSKETTNDFIDKSHVAINQRKERELMLQNRRNVLRFMSKHERISIRLRYECN